MQYLFIYLFFIYSFTPSYQNLQYLFQDMRLLTHYISLIFLRVWQNSLQRKKVNLTQQLHSILIIRYVTQITTSDLRKFKFITLIFHNIFSYPL
jgi:hypothetical protein